MERTKELAGLEHQINVVVIDHLRELERRRLYLTIGFSSLFDYAVRELGYSDAAAWRRIKAMRLCAGVDGARERLQDGSLTIAAAAELQHAFDRQEHKQTGARTAAPSGPAPAGTEPSTEPPAAPVLDDSARQALVKQAAGKSTRQVRAMLADVDPELAAQADRMRPLGADRWELKAVIDGDCQHGLERLKDLLSHVDPHMTLGQIVGRLVQEGLDRHDPGRPPRGRRTGSRAAGVAQTSAPKDEAGTNVARTSAPKVDTDAERDGASGANRPERRGQAGASAPKSERAPQRQATPSKPRVVGRAIPVAVRREVWERDQGCCSYVDRGSGRRCGSRYQLQVDHVFAYALGGKAEPGNLRLLCAAHHRRRHARDGAARRNE